MRLKTLFILPSLLLLFAGCEQFQENMKEDQEATSIQSLNAKQSDDVDQFAEGGQLNAYEEEQMQESINGQ